VCKQIESLFFVSYAPLIFIFIIENNVNVINVYWFNKVIERKKSYIYIKSNKKKIYELENCTYGLGY